MKYSSIRIISREKIIYTRLRKIIYYPWVNFVFISERICSNEKVLLREKKKFYLQEEARTKESSVEIGKNILGEG